MKHRFEHRSSIKWFLFLKVKWLLCGRLLQKSRWQMVVWTRVVVFNGWFGDMIKEVVLTGPDKVLAIEWKEMRRIKEQFQDYHLLRWYREGQGAEEDTVHTPRPPHLCSISHDVSSNLPQAFFSYIFIWCEGKLLSHVRLFATPWTVAYQAPPYMEFSRQEYWSGLSSSQPRMGFLKFLTSQGRSDFTFFPYKVMIKVQVEREETAQKKFSLWAETVFVSQYIKSTLKLDQRGQSKEMNWVLYALLRFRYHGTFNKSMKH